MEKKEKKSLIQTYISAYNTFDIKCMLSVLDPDIEFSNISDGEETAKASGLEEFENLAKQSVNLFSSREQKIEAMEIQDSKIIVTIAYSGVLASDMPNGLKAGQSIELRGMSEFKFKAGKISSITDRA